MRQFVKISAEEDSHLGRIDESVSDGHRDHPAFETSQGQQRFQFGQTLIGHSLLSAAENCQLKPKLVH